MANTTAPRSSTFKGWFFDAVNGQLEYWYNGTKVGAIDASGHDITDDTTTYMSNGVVASAGLTSSAAIGSGALATNARTYIHRLGTHAAVASNGAGAILADAVFVAPLDCRIVSAWKMNISASDVTKGTATTSASYRRFNLISNTAGTGSGTDIVCSLNATASAASLATRSFSTVASTIPAGAIVLASHLTVGAETGDGTDAAAGIIEIAYQLV